MALDEILIEKDRSSNLWDIYSFSGDPKGSIFFHTETNMYQFGVMANKHLTSGELRKVADFLDELNGKEEE